MSRILRSKSGTFLMELIFNLLLFCFLCSCGLLFFSKSHNLTKDTTALHQAVSLTTSVASIYESGDGSLAYIKDFYPCVFVSEQEIQIYFDEEFAVCNAENAHYYIAACEKAVKGNGKPVQISLHKSDGEEVYSLTAYYLSRSTLEQLKEVQHDE